MTFIPASAATANLTNGQTITTTESTASLSYIDLSTVGPAVTITTNTSVLISMSGVVFRSSGTGNTAYISVAVSGATTIAANDTNAVSGVEAVAVSNVSLARTFILTGLTPGSNTFTLKYKVDGGNYSFLNRSLVITVL